MQLNNIIKKNFVAVWHACSFKSQLQNPLFFQVSESRGAKPLLDRSLPDPTNGFSCKLMLVGTRLVSDTRPSRGDPRSHYFPRTFSIHSLFDSTIGAHSTSIYSQTHFYLSRQTILCCSVLGISHVTLLTVTQLHRGSIWESRSIETVLNPFNDPWRMVCDPESALFQSFVESVANT